MKRRLRKKRFRGEFAVFGFACRFRLQPPLTAEEADRFGDEFMAHMEKHDLAFSGGCGTAEWNGIIRHRNPRCSATQAHREVISAWLHPRPNVRQAKIGRLTDLNYGSFDDGGHTRSDEVLGD
jgi:uncharacterized protein YggL (DUF469 family)